MNNTQTNFFKQSHYTHRDDKNNTSSEHKNKFKKTGISVWPKIKENSSEQKLEYGRSLQKFNTTRSSFNGDAVSITYKNSS